jgi:hypothetical protein
VTEWESVWTDLNAAKANLDEWAEHAMTTFQDQGAKGLRSVMVLEAYCDHKRSCPLLYVWKSQGSLLYYAPPYQLSPTRNDATSTSAGRAANTTNGEDQWRARAGLFEHLRGFPAITLGCDHVYRQYISPSDLLDLADAAKPGRPTRRRIGKQPEGPGTL